MLKKEKSSNYCSYWISLFNLVRLFVWYRLARAESLGQYPIDDFNHEFRGNEEYKKNMHSAIEMVETSIFPFVEKIDDKFN